MRRRLGRVLGRRGQADHGLAVRQGHDLLLTRGRFDLAQAFLVQRHHVVQRDLLLLQLAHHGAVIGVRQVALLRDQAGRDVHLVADFRERGQRLGDQLLRADVDAELVQVVGVDRRRQAVVGACQRQQLLAHIVVIGRQLLFQRGKGRLPAVQAALFQFLLHALDQGRAVVERLLQLADIRAQQFRIGLQAFLGALLGQFGDRTIALDHAGIFLQPYQQRLLALFRNARVQHLVHHAEQQLVQVLVRQHQLALQRVGLQLVVGGADQDLQVLADLGIGFRLQALLQLGYHGMGILDAGVVEIARHIGDQLIVAVHAQAAGTFRRILGHQVQQQLGVVIALRNPALFCGGGNAGPGGQRQRDGAQQGSGFPVWFRHGIPFYGE